MAMADRDRERGEEGEGLEFGYCFDVSFFRRGGELCLRACHCRRRKDELIGTR